MENFPSIASHQRLSAFGKVFLFIMKLDDADWFCYWNPWKSSVISFTFLSVIVRLRLDYPAKWRKENLRHIFGRKLFSSFPFWVKKHSMRELSETSKQMCASKYFSININHFLIQQAICTKYVVVEWLGASFSSREVCWINIKEDKPIFISSHCFFGQTRNVKFNTNR